MKRALLVALSTCLLVSAAACDNKKELSPEELAKITANKIAEGEADVAGGKECVAQEKFMWVLEREPDNAAAHAGLARVFLEKKDVATAMTHAVKAVAGAPQDAKTQALMGEVYKQSEKHAEAAGAFAKAWELAPDDSRYGYAQGKALLETKSWAEAETVLRKVGEDDEQIQFVWTSLGDALREQDKQDDALRMYMKGQNTYASDKGAFAGAAQVYEAKGEFHKAHKQVSNYIQRDCCSNYSNEWAKPKLLELEAKFNAEGAADGDGAEAADAG